MKARFTLIDWVGTITIVVMDTYLGWLVFVEMPRVYSEFPQ